MESEHGAKRYLSSLIIGLAALAISVFVPNMQTLAASDTMTITAVDIGSDTKSGNPIDEDNYGDSVILTTGGKTLIMDTAQEKRSNHVISWLKARGRKNVDIYVSHYHDDHVYNITTIIKDPYFNVGTLYLPKPDYLNRAYPKNQRYIKRHHYDYMGMLDQAQRHSVKIVWLDKGSSFDYGNAKVEILWGANFDSDSRYGTEYINNNSLVARITCGGVRYLTAGDCLEDEEKQMIAAGIDLRADIFKANHHGASNGNSAAFLAKVQPSFSFSNCTDNSNNQLGVGYDEVTYKRLIKYGNVYGVTYNGDLNFMVQGGKVTVSAGRNLTNMSYDVFGNSCNIQVASARHFKVTNRMKEMATGLGDWEKVDGKWKFKFVSGSYAANKVVFKDGKAYYLDPAGNMVTGWYRRPDGGVYFAAESGSLFMGWNKLSNKWYYFDKTTCQRAQGWKQIDSKWYYFDASGVMQTGLVQIGGKTYYLNMPSNAGAMRTGWVKIGSSWYYFGADGAMRTGWINLSGSWYYMASDGVMQIGWKQIGGKWYYLNTPGNAGAMRTGWIKFDNKWYYFGTDGTLRTGWDYYGGKWYYVNPENATHSSGFTKIGSKYYYFDPTTKAMVEKTWIKDNGKWYYAASGGALKNNEWMYSGGKWYYFKGCAAVTGVQEIDGSYYFFDKSTAMVLSKWVTEGEDRYYARSGGKLCVGWMMLNDKWYYFDEDAKEIFGRKQIRDDFYFFDRETGEMRTDGWIEDEYEIRDEISDEDEIRDEISNKDEIRDADKTGDENETLIETVRETLYANEDGRLAVGLVEIEGVTYYFNEEGVLQRNTETDDGFTDENGVFTKKSEDETDSTAGSTDKADSAAEDSHEQDAGTDADAGEPGNTDSDTRPDSNAASTQENMVDVQPDQTVDSTDSASNAGSSQEQTKEAESAADETASKQTAGEQTAGENSPADTAESAAAED